MSIAKYLDKLENLYGKEILITGGTSGIGLHIVDQLLYKGADVTILARNQNKALEVKNKMLKKYPNGQINLINYDQSSFESIQDAVNEILTNHGNFYALILNAGVFARGENAKGNTTIKTNFVGIGYFLKTLVPNLKNKHRIILQGSLCAGYKLKRINSLDDEVSNWQQYLISKAGVEMLYYHYNELNYPNLSFYLIEPGLTSTAIIREFPTPIRELGTLFLKVASHAPSKAALTAMKALQEDAKPCFIVPRGFLDWRGYPKVKAFPKKRVRTSLYQLLETVI